MMPSTYAHYRFGKEMLERLPGGIRASVERAPGLFLIGQHGPDILFYYHALTNNPVVRRGHAMHERPAAGFFIPALDILRDTKISEDEGERAYIYGFACHFMLDSCTHWYIEDRIAESGVSHTEIEAEFDRMLMQTDGLDPVSHRPITHIIPSERNVRVITRFFPGITEKGIKKTLEDMRFYLGLLVCPGRVKRKLMTGGTDALGLHDSVGGMIINREPNPECRESNAYLMKLYETALHEAARYLPEIERAVNEGSRLSKRWMRTFGPDAESKELYQI